MKMRNVAIAQFNPRPGRLEENAARMVAWIREAEQQGAELVVFPEDCISGYCIGDLQRNRSLVHSSFDVLMREVLPQVGRISAVVGLTAPGEEDEGQAQPVWARNSFVVMREGRILHSGAKTLLVNEGVLDDARYFRPQHASEVVPVLLPGPEITSVGVLVCQDMWDDDSLVKPASILASKGAQLLVVINSSPFHVGKVQERLEVAQRRVAETGLPLVYVNTVGAQDNGKNIILFDGASFMLDSDGSLVAHCPGFEEGLYFPEVPTTLPPVDRVGQLAHALEFGIRQFFGRTGHTGAVIGLSGGVDSALNAAFLAKALGPENLLCLNMPTRFSSLLTQDNAATQAKRLGVEYVVSPIQEVVELKRRLYEQHSGRTMNGLTFENVQARERGNVLMTWAQERGRLVVGNGNKTEFQRGYATLYGDLIGAVMTLGDISKADVYRLANWANEAWDGVIPQGVIDVAPSAELSEAQDVNQGLGDPFDYDVEAPMGVEIIENGRSPEELRRLFEENRLDPLLWSPVRSSSPVYQKMNGSEFEQYAWRVLRAIEATVFKRVQSPPILKLSRRAFGFDLRESLFARLP